MALVSIALLVALIFLVTQFPRFGKVLYAGSVAVLAVGGILAAIGAYAYWQDIRRLERSRLISPSELSLTQVILSEGPIGWTVRGRVTNKSPAYTLLGFDLSIALTDCPPLAEGVRSPPDCVAVGQARASQYLHVPPNQTGTFQSRVIFPDMPPVRELRWSYNIEQVRADAD